MTIGKDAIPLYVPQGSSIQISRARPNNFGQFQAVGVFSTKDKVSKNDVLETMAELSRGAQQLFLQQKLFRDDSNLVIIPRWLPVGSTQYKSLMRNCKEINKTGLTGMIKKPHTSALKISDLVFADFHMLMLNPSFIKCRNQAEAQVFWRLISEKKKNNKYLGD